MTLVVQDTFHWASERLSVCNSRKAAPVQQSLDVSSILLVWPQRECLSDASPPSTRVFCLYWMNAFVEKDKLSGEQIRRMESRSSSQCGKATHELEICLLTDKLIKGKQMSCLGALKSITSVSLNIFCLIQLFNFIWATLGNPHMTHTERILICKNASERYCTERHISTE